MKLLRIFILLTGSFLLLLIPKKVTNACGFYVLPGEYRFWLLQPDLTNQYDLTPFYFASTYLYKSKENGDETYPQQNIREWMQEIRERDKTAGSVQPKDIDTLLNNTTPEAFFEQTGHALSGNSFARFLRQAGNADLYDYLRLSKKVEQIAAEPDPWDEGVVTHAGINRVIDEAKKLYSQSHSPFVKLRTAFQLMRLHAYNGNSREVSKTYDDRIAPVPTRSWIKSAALYLKAIRGDMPGDRLLAEVFDRGDYRRSQCLIRFQSSLTDSLVNTTQDKHQRAVLRAMKVLNYPGRALSMIEAIYAEEPGYTEIPFVLLREINKIEDWLLTNRLTSFPSATGNSGDDRVFTDDWAHDMVINRQADQAYAKKLNRFLLRLVNEKKVMQPWLIRLYASHLAMITGDQITAGVQLEAAAKSKNLPLNVRTQIAINRFLLQLETALQIDVSIENNLVRLLRQPAKQSGIYDAGIMKDQLILYTARKMISKGSRAKGLMLLSKTNRAWADLPIGKYKNVYQEITEIATPADYDSIIAILGHHLKTPFEKFVTEGSFGSPDKYYGWYDEKGLTWNKNRLLDGKASWYIRNNNLQAALQTLQQIPASFWEKEPYKEYTGGNPFFLSVYETGRYYGKRVINYNKRTIIERMLQLQSIAARIPSKKAECHYQLANAWYNMTWYGNNWLMVKPWRSMHELYYNVKRNSFNDFYYGCNRARELYIQAMKETSDKKLAILCCFMAEQCDSRQKDYMLAVYKQSPGTGDRKNPYLRDLKQKGISEDSYLEFVNECALYQDYTRTFDKAL